MANFIELKEALEDCLNQELNEGFLKLKDLPDNTNCFYDSDLDNYTVILPNDISFSFVENELSIREHPLLDTDDSPQAN